MINKIDSLKNLGIFTDYKWEADLPEFKRYNVIYGNNGSGKTTLSKLFDIVRTNNHSDYPELKYKITIGNQPHTEKSASYENIRVFNKDYVNQNVNLDISKVEHIFILGEENKKLTDRIKEIQVILDGDSNDINNRGLKYKLEELNKEKEVLNKQINQIFTDIATIIRESGVTAINKSFYHRTHALEEYDKLTDFTQIGEQKAKELQTEIHQETPIELKTVNINPLIDKLVKYVKSLKMLMPKTVTVIAIERLQNNPDIQKWIIEGRSLHTRHNSLFCEYCGQEIPQERLKQFEGFFNEEVETFNKEIDEIIQNLEVAHQGFANLRLVDKANVTLEHRSEYSEAKERFETEKSNFISTISEIIQEAENKKLHPFQELKLQTVFDTKDILLQAKIIDNILTEHNKRCHDFQEHIEKNKSTLRRHYLIERHDEIQEKRNRLNEVEEKIHSLEYGNQLKNILGIYHYEEEIEKLEAKISHTEIACEEINKSLQAFLGREELMFENTKNGYIIKRNGKPAKNLSEGEKTAIAFVHFTTKLKDKDFENSNGIVLIDDPISSLDSNSLFQAYSFVKNSVKDCKQVFLLTHNYNFLQLILDWFRNINSHGKDKNACSYFMIRNAYVNGVRNAELVKMDPLLQKYKTEYQYIFCKLKNFKFDGTIEQAYTVPNLARKLLEHFLNILIPTNDNIYRKLDKVKFDKQKKDAIYKFINVQSHYTGGGFDPALIGETRNNLTYLFEMMSKTFPNHYKHLESLAEENK